MRLTKYINEASYTQEDLKNVPYFYVVFYLEDIIDDILNGEIKGIKGISSSGEIKFHFLGVARDAMLKMNAEKVVKKNKLSKIMYDNPHYLVSKDMSALYRIFNKPRSKSGKDGLLTNLFDYFRSSLKQLRFNSVLLYDLEYHSISGIAWDLAKTLPKINGVKDLTKHIMNYMEDVFSIKTGRKYNMSYNHYYTTVWNALLNIGKIYNDEKEWVLKDRNLKIPSDSEIYILFPTIDKLKDEKMKVVDYYIKNNDINVDDLKKMGISQDVIIWAKINSYEVKSLSKLISMINRIKRKYKVHIVDKKEFEKERSKRI